MKLINNRWVDDNNNSWSANLETEESAIAKSKTLINCSYCSYCSGYKQNPERITSPLIGSRKSSTTVYWIGDNVQVVCGCFKGDLQKFKYAVQETHGNNEHGVAYNNFIAKVENYINTQNKEG